MTPVRRIAITLAISAAGLAAILLDEGNRNEAYLDPVGIPTLCAGHTAGVKLGDRATDEVCAELLRQDAHIAEDAVRRLVKVPITQAQFDALVSFVFNVGVDAFAKSTLLRKINAGDCAGAVSEFPRWVYAKGKKLPGLVKRRNGEAARYAGGCR